MALLERRLDCTIDKVKNAISYMKMYEPEEGYRLSYSGGKDSGAILRLAEMAGVKYEAHYSLTSVDSPALVNFVKSNKKIIIDKPRYISGEVAGKQKTMWNLIPIKKMPPTRLCRYCCSELKESMGDGRLIVTGVRWAESVARKNNQGLVNIFGNTKKDRIIYNFDDAAARRAVEMCYRTRKTLINPIIDWTTEDVWEFHKVENIAYCEEYGTITKNFTCTGKKRLGCIGCPMSTKQKRELEVEYPKYKGLYIAAFDRMLERLNNADWKSGEEVYNWWVGGYKNKTDKRQLNLWDANNE